MDLVKIAPQAFYESNPMSQVLMKLQTKLAFVLATACVVSAHKGNSAPYASTLNNNSGNISFILNESADNVRVYWNGGANSASLGALPAGLFAQDLGITGDFFVEVSKLSGDGYTTAVSPNVAGVIKISSDPLLARFNSPRGLAVSSDPQSPYFGRVYVANSAIGTTAVGGRSVGDGLYVLNADLTDAFGHGNTARDGGFAFGGSASSPYRITVGQDGFVYVSDWSDANGQLVRFQGDLNSAERVLSHVGGPSTITSPTNHGSIAALHVEGSLAAGNLKVWTIDEDYTAGGTQPKNSLWRYDVNSGPLPTDAAPTFVNSSLLTGATADLARGPDGKWYLMQFRSAGNEAGLFVLDSSGAPLADSLSLWRGITGDPLSTDVLNNLQGIAISYDGDFMAATLSGPSGSDTWIIPLIDGIPDLANRLLLDSGAVTQGRDVAFDIAGNLYTLSSGDQLLSVFSPGGGSLATTGSDGSFIIVVPEPSTYALGLLGFGALLFARRRKK